MSCDEYGQGDHAAGSHEHGTKLACTQLLKDNARPESKSWTCLRHEPQAWHIQCSNVSQKMRERSNRLTEYACCPASQLSWMASIWTLEFILHITIEAPVTGETQLS